MSKTHLTAALNRPTALPRRDGPNMGNGQTVACATLREQDRSAVQEIYAFLLDIYAKTCAFDGNPGNALETLRGLDEAQLSLAFSHAQNLGAGLDSSESDVHKALHDVRGGSLAALLTHIDLIHMGIAGAVDAERVHLLVRDHLKMMRNALYDLDPPRYAHDLDERTHGIELLVEKWTQADYPVAARRVTVQLHTDFDGVVSERCMEFSSLDRVLYNLVNNAGRFAADQHVDILAEPVEYDGDVHLRFSVINVLTPDQEQALEERFGDELSKVFEGGFTTGGHGLGLRVCADLVRHAYSLSHVRKAIAQHILGAHVVDGHYVAWFHWPARRGDT